MRIAGSLALGAGLGVGWHNWCAVGAANTMSNAAGAVEAASWMPTVGVGTAVGTGVGSSRRAASVSMQRAVEGASAAGSHCLVGRRGPFPRCSGGGVAPFQGCWRWTMSADGHQEVHLAAGRSCRGSQCPAHDRSLRPPRRTHPTPWTTCSRGASSSHRGGYGHGIPARPPCGSGRCSRTSQGTFWRRRR